MKFKDDEFIVNLNEIELKDLSSLGKEKLLKFLAQSKFQILLQLENNEIVVETQLLKSKYLTELGKEKLIEFLVQSKFQMSFKTFVEKEYNDYIESRIEAQEYFSPPDEEYFRDIFVEYEFLLPSNFEFALNHQAIIDIYFNGEFDDF
ncbi:hypothetical protein [Candidatus Phytoplasma pyri]|uniref:hypothetical protein n=1 Tax=Candidatus Phytoplasma pyri TaxID=47566 RepID=UPI0039831BC6